MYKISVPVINKKFKRANREKMVEILLKTGTERVFLALDTYAVDENERAEVLASLRENTEFLKKYGLEVGAWIWTFWVKHENSYTHMKFTNGTVSKDFVCPSDKDFRKFAGEYVKDIARCGVDMIMYDDDLRYGFFDSEPGCICENHIKYMEEITGEKITETEIKEKLVRGGRNKYRSAWLEANRHFFIEFAKEMRENLDEVNPEIRFGPCSCMSVWDMDGATTIEISKILAGNTKPFLRLIGAPYWAVHKSWGNRLQDVIELERMELSWCENEDIETMAEGDVFPRPRFNCPSSYLEGFDTALRADGRVSGILKYMLDYTSGADYETGYVERHIANTGLYKGIEEIFAGKEAAGVRVYEAMKKFENMDVPETVSSDKVQDIFFSPASRMLTSSSIPTIYSGSGICGIAFGENIKYVPEEAFEKGLIIDARAAEILSEKGIDTGMIAKNDTLGAKIEYEVIYTREEYFPAENEYVHVNFGSGVYEIEVNENAVIQSWFVEKYKKYPASYIYENKNGQRFFVFAFDGYFMSEWLYRQYTRSKQLVENIKWLSGKSLPAYLAKSPDLYTMCKNNDTAMAVGLWNFSSDSIIKPVVKLDREYKNIKFINCSGTLCGNEVILSEIEAFKFAGFEVE